MAEQDSLTNDLIFKKEKPSFGEWRYSIYIIYSLLKGKGSLCTE